MPVRRSSNHIPSSPVEAAQGIVTILGGDCDRKSIRRTLSADMSSKKWLQENGFFSPVKKVVSSREMAMADEEEVPNQDQVWRSIQSQNEKNEVQQPAQSGVWDLILTQKSENSLLQTPYVHPMVKRSKSSLTDKSLHICTESLGSETGSDCFSPHEVVSSDGDHEGEREEMVMVEEDPFAHLHVVKYKKSPPRPFPPPLPSITAADGAASLHMHSRRDNGRLVLEAVTVPPMKYFHAHRHDGRLLLTLTKNHNVAPNLEKEEVDQFEQVFDDMEAVGEEVNMDHDSGGSITDDDGYEAAAAAVVERKSGGGGRKEEFLVEQNLSLPTGMISVHKSMKKLMAEGNINPKWCDDVATQSLPPRPPPAARVMPPAAAFNAYEYFWRSKPGFMNTNKSKIENQDLVVYMRRCKEARTRRSLLWEPYCIATS